MHQQREADSDHDSCRGINHQKGNTSSFFKLRKLTSHHLFIGEWRHIIWDKEETQIPKSCRAENTERKEKASLNEFALRDLWALLNEIPKARDLSMRKEIINLGLIWNKTCISLSTCYRSPIMREKREKKNEHTIEICLNLSCCIHVDMNKRNYGRKEWLW